MPFPRDKKDSSPQCIKVLDFALAGPAGTKCCETFVEALGLKSLFSAFMGKVRLLVPLGVPNSTSSDTMKFAGLEKGQSQPLIRNIRLHSPHTRYPLLAFHESPLRVRSSYARPSEIRRKQLREGRPAP